MFNVDNISKKFKTDFWEKEFFALSNVSFEIKSGEIVGFLGANGAGKTTFLKILLGFISSSSGKIEYDNNLGTGRDIFKNIGYMPERPYYYAHLTGYEFLDYCGKLQDLDEDTIKSQTDKWAKELKIDFALNRKIQSYSKGMLQRLGFTSSLIHDPMMIILDEPLSGLDPLGRKEFKDILVKLNKLGKTVFFSSHIVSDVEEICKRVVVLEQGKMIFSGAIDQLISKSIKPIYEFSITKNKDIENEYKDFFSHANSDLSFFNIPILKKDLIIKELISKNVEIISIQKHRVSLESVIYNLQGD